MALKHCVLELQATNILNEAYCSRRSGQLAHQEAKKTESGGNYNINRSLLLSVITSFLCLIPAILDMTYHLRLQFLLLLSPDYTPDIVLISKKLLVAAPLSFLSRIYTMLFN